MDRFPLRCRQLVIALGLALILTGVMGCQSLFFTVAYLIKGVDAPAECDKLIGKKVAVVCRPVASLTYRFARVDSDIAEQVTALLGASVKKIKIVPASKVGEWTDSNTWDDFPEVGKAVQADLVVGIDLTRFDLFQGQTLYQGKANTEVRVFDCKTGKVIFKKQMPQTVYPPNSVVPTSEKQESAFRQEFVKVVAERISWLFTEHDRNADMDLDTRAM